MNGPRTCPVCGLENIPEGQGKCPQCDSELACFAVLDSLSCAGEQRSRTILELSRPVLLLLLLPFLILAGSIAFQFYWLRQMESAYSKELSFRKEEGARQKAVFDLDLARLTSALDQSAAEHKSVQEDLSRLQKKMPEFRPYRIKKGDTLWKIAKEQYGTGAVYPLLIFFNPQLKSRDLKAGTTINILTGMVPIE